MSELPAEIAEQITKLGEGEISPAFTWTNEKGEIVCSVVKLKKRIDEHYADVTEDFQMLKNIVVEMRSQEKINSWIQEKQKKTYVRINPEWRDCDFQYPYWAK
jgi:peptidyl-prolyl cis-trans isomerase SurA